MRAREKTSNRAWFTHITHPAGPLPTPDVGSLYGPGDTDANVLVHRLRLYIVLETDADAFVLRCYSTAQSEMMGMPFGATCHRGTDLGAVTGAAVCDWHMLKSGRATYRASTVEQAIWVPF